MSWWTSSQPDWAAKMEARITDRLEQIMARVQVEQADLDALDVALDAATTAISDRIQALIDAAPVPLPDAELSALLEDVESLKALGSPPPV